MNSASPAIRVLTLSALVAAGLSRVAAPASHAAEGKREGDKIIFSAPGSTAVTRPVSERDLPDRRMGFGSGAASDPAGSLPSGMAMPLPGSEQVNRVQALQQLLELSGSMNGKSGLWENDASAEDVLRPKGSETRLGIDDLFERPRESNRRSDDNEPFSLDSSVDRSEANRNDLRLPDARGNNDAVQIDELRGQINAGDDAKSFLPGFDSALGLGSDRHGRAADHFLGIGSSPSSAWMKSREDAERRARSDRMDSFRKLLGGTQASPSSLGGYGRGTSVPGGFTSGTAPESAATRRGALDSPSFLSPIGAEASSAGRNLALPARSVELDMGIGQNRNPSRRDLELQAPPPVSPMELLRQKHNTPMPKRVF